MPSDTAPNCKGAKNGSNEARGGGHSSPPSSDESRLPKTQNIEEMAMPQFMKQIPHSRGKRLAVPILLCGVLLASCSSVPPLSTRELCKNSAYAKTASNHGSKLAKMSQSQIFQEKKQWKGWIIRSWKRWGKHFEKLKDLKKREVLAITLAIMKTESTFKVCAQNKESSAFGLSQGVNRTRLNYGKACQKLGTCPEVGDGDPEREIDFIIWHLFDGIKICHMSYTGHELYRRLYMAYNRGPGVCQNGRWEWKDIPNSTQYLADKVARAAVEYRK